MTNTNPYAGMWRALQCKYGEEYEVHYLEYPTPRQIEDNHLTDIRLIPEDEPDPTEDKEPAPSKDGVLEELVYYHDLEIE